ncbi:transposon-encoded TnpW family protein [Ruminococcaceae bacterium OttesenSCG-928-A16]|mgnify:CR=1 FL=1|nr:transposon-encoded TnpW family protein [Ruminococcaceae bacterium OttesenSCG-928-A16]
MNTENITTTATQAEQPALVKQIGKTTYKVKVHFSETSKETMSDKIVRMLKSEISQMQSLS